MNHAELLPLYQETLFEVQESAKNDLQQIGEFRQKVMALVRKAEWNETNIAFLKKILLSCNLTENDYLIVSLPDDADMFAIVRQRQPATLFLFGIKLESTFFKSNRSVYKPFSLNGMRMVLADNLEMVKMDKDKRLALWNQCIKPLFNIA